MQLVMIKYTLYCNKGVLFKSGTHFLTIGDWLPYRPDRIILQHGMFTDAEARQIKSQTYVNVYQSACHNIVSVTEPYNSRYMERKKDKELLQAYIGALVRENENLWTGRVHVR